MMVEVPLQRNEDTGSPVPSVPNRRTVERALRKKAYRRPNEIRSCTKKIVVRESDFSLFEAIENDVGML